MAEAALTKWGEVADFRIPQAFLNQFWPKTGGEGGVTLNKKELVISKIVPSLQDVLQECSTENRAEELSQEPHGKGLI